MMYSDERDILPSNFKLYNNHPNPFNPITTIRYDLPTDELVNISVYDMKGRMVKTLVNGSQNTGQNAIKWNGTNNKNEQMSAGIYLYTIQIGDFRQSKKMVLLK